MVDALVDAGLGQAQTDDNPDVADHGLAGRAMWHAVIAALALTAAFWRRRHVSTRVDRRHHGPEVATRLRRANPPVSHPLVRTHPATGEALLFLSPLYLRRLTGIERRQGDRKLRELNGLLEDPHVQVRWRWEAGDVAIWDEVATCHRALTDHIPQRRIMRRCVVQGDGPR